MNHALLLFFSLLLFSCGTARPGDGSATISADGSEVRPDGSMQTNDLTDYFRRLSGVQVSGSGPSASIRIRGIISVSAPSTPLFILDGNNLGRDYGSVHGIVDVTQVDNIRVLKDASDISLYGVQGAAGVIVITTKK